LYHANKKYKCVAFVDKTVDYLRVGCLFIIGKKMIELDK